MKLKLNLRFISIIFLLLNACAAQTLKLESVPTGAQIFSKETNIGTTPFTMDKELIQKNLDNGILNLKFTSAGYETYEVTSLPNNLESIQVKLTQLDEKYFSQKFIQDFQKQSNLMIRDILTIQALIVSGKSAETEITAFKSQYPNIAAPYVFQANLEMKKGNWEQAQSELLRAQTIDNSDPVIKRLLKNTKGDSTEKSP